jgi:hypothetical protein
MDRAGTWRDKRLLMAGGCVVAVLATFGALLWGGDSRSPRHTVNGTFVVNTVPDDGCGQAGWDAISKLDRLNALLAGQVFPCPDGPGGGYTDLRDGTSVSLSDGDGKLLATGSLTGGTLRGDGVTFTFHLSDVPETAFYKLEVANRGQVPYSEQQMGQSGWKLNTSVG